LKASRFSVYSNQGFLENQRIFAKLPDFFLGMCDSHMAMVIITSTAVEGQPRCGVELLDEELRQGDTVIRTQGLIPTLPVQHQVLIRICIWGATTNVRDQSGTCVGQW
jgi:hypothetical protein